MDFFAILRNNLAMGGIKNLQKSTKIHPFNVINSTVSILLCATVSSIALSFNEANTFDECIDILYRSVSIGICGIIYEIIVWRTSKLFGIIDSLADTVNASELKYSFEFQNFNKNDFQN